jgi:RNA polymerase sigma-70 factor (ECF subfamily)
LRAWDEFVERYRPMIRAWRVKWRLQESDADDVVQEVLIKLLAAIRTFKYDPERSFRAWLKTVTQHALSDFAASRRKNPGQMESPIDLIAESDDARTDLEQQIQEAYEAELLALAMHRVQKRVKPAAWEAFRLTLIDGQSVAEAAGKLEIPVAHVFVAEHRVQKMLQEEVRILKKEPR